MKKILLNFSTTLVGLLFIFSGAIKANDPLGFGYKLQEYFEVFHITFLHDFAPAIAIILCAAEIILGALLFLGFWSRKVSAGLAIVIILFTFLTFYSAFFKVVSSCGCFGDAIPLTPWQSFSKDLVLGALIFFIFINRDRIQPVIQSENTRRIVLAVVTFIAFGFGLYTYNFLPVFDFLPYKIGASIPRNMRTPPGAEPDIYEITYRLKNRKTGESKTMTDKEYLKTEIWKDTNWEIVGQPENKLIKKGYDVPIKDLKVTDSQGTDYTAEIFENPYYNLVFVVYDLDKTNLKAVGNLNAIAMNAAENFNIRSVLLTSNSALDADQFSKENKLLMEVFYADGIPLKSMVRANPGIMLLKDGYIINKWHYHTMPSYQELADKYFEKNQ